MTATRFTLAACLLGSAMASHAQVELFSLGSLADRTDSVAFDINESGQVVGQSFNDRGVPHAFIWDNGVMSDLDPFNPDTPSNAWALNDAGTAVGYVAGRDGLFEAMMWSGGTGTNLDAQNRAAGPSQIFDINNDGTMVGGFSLDGGFTKPAVLDANGDVIAQPLSGFNEGGFMRGINTSGTVVGHDFTFGTPDDAMVLSPDAMGNYGTPNKLQEQLGNDFFPFTLAYDINDACTIVGTSNNGSGTSEAAVWTLNGDDDYELTLLGTLGTQDTALAWGVNAHGVIVGQSRDEDPSLSDPRAFVVLDGRMLDLNDYLTPNDGFVHLLGAHAVNDHGDIVGFGQTEAGTVEAFVMRGVVPAPGSLAAFALVGMAATRRRRG